MSMLMIVVDDDTIRETIIAILSRMGHDIIEARDGQEALNIYKVKHDLINLIIMDITMPKMNGIAASVAMREVNPNAKIILVSGYSDKVTGSLKPTAFLAKPFGGNALCEIVRQVLQTS